MECVNHVERLLQWHKGRWSHYSVLKKNKRVLSAGQTGGWKPTMKPVCNVNTSSVKPHRISEVSLSKTHTLHFKPSDIFPFKRINCASHHAHSCNLYYMVGLTVHCDAWQSSITEPSTIVTSRFKRASELMDMYLKERQPKSTKMTDGFTVNSTLNLRNN